MRTRYVSMAAIVAAAYAALVWLFQPISFLQVQVRVADALIMLPSVLGPPAVIGVWLGAVVANLLAPWQNPLFVAADMALGSLANLVSGYLVYRISYGKGLRERLAGGVAAVAVVSLVVGSYLPFLLGLPPTPYVFATTYALLAAGSAVSILAIGVPLSKGVEKALSG